MSTSTLKSNEVNNTPGDSDVFKEVPSRKKNVVTVGNGKKTNKSVLKSVPKEKHIHIYRLDTQTMIRNHVEDVIEVKVLNCEKMLTRNAGIYSSF